MLVLSNYDAWKLATPPEYERAESEEEQYMRQLEDEEERQRVEMFGKCHGCRPAPAFRAEPINDEIPF